MPEGVAPRFALLSCMKDEGPFVLEFVAHYRVLGFDLIAIATNDCSDGTDVLCAALAEAGFIRHLDHSPPDNKAPQHVGYKALRKSFPIDACDWALAIDADEFVNVHVGDRTIGALVAEAPDAVDVIALSSMTFGTTTIYDWQPGRICAQITKRLPADHEANRPIKSLTRAPHRFKAFHNHSMVRFEGALPLTVMRGDGSLFEINERVRLWDHLRRFEVADIGHSLAQYNHYAIKSEASYVLRRQRGRGAVARQEDTKLRWTDRYFQIRAAADIDDTSIEDYAGDVETTMAKILSHASVSAAQAEVERRYGELVRNLRK